MSTCSILRIYQFVVLALIFIQTTQSLDLSKTALIIVDVQNDFCAGGSLATPHGDDVIPVINKLRSNLNFSMVVFTMDWHPPNHISFYERFSDKSKHPDAQLYKEYSFDLEDGHGNRTQILWPTHAVQNSTGAELRIGLHREPTDFIVFKGTTLDRDSYSGFFDNDNKSETEMDSILKKAGIEELVITGLAFEYCVGFTALHGIDKGYKVTVVEDATGSFGDKEGMIERIKMAGGVLKKSEELLNLPVERHACNCPACNCPDCECAIPGNSSSCMCNSCMCTICTCN